MAKVLVTGASGFIGGHLVELLLERGDDVTCLTRASSCVDRLVELGVRLVRRDLPDADGLQDVVAGTEVVYHLAGMTKALSQDLMAAVNTKGTVRLAETCAAQLTPPVMLFVSSVAAAGPAADGQPIRETDPCRPVSYYGRSKRAAELALARYAGRVPITIVRPPIVFGPRDSGCLEIFKAIHRTGVHVIPGYRRRRYSVVHSAELVAAIVAAAAGGARIDPADAEADGFGQGCYFVAQDQHPTYSELGSLVAQSLGRRFVFKLPVPDWGVTLAGRANDLMSKMRGRPHIFSSDKAREATAGSWICSTQRIHDELGFKPSATLADRLRATADWYRQEGWL